MNVVLFLTRGELLYECGPGECGRMFSICRFYYFLSIEKGHVTILIDENPMDPAFSAFCAICI